MSPRAFISGIADKTLSVAERSFLREADPWGVIFFGRNVESPEQVKRLSASISKASKCVDTRRLGTPCANPRGPGGRSGPAPWPAG
jgi:beta-N-acetylhexosaminidase